MNMLSFYGGPAGKDFTIAKTFDSKFSLDADIAAGDASEIYAGDYVLVSYGDPNTPAFSDNRKKDGDKSYNATLWKKDWNNGYEYRLICYLTVDYPLFVAGTVDATLPFGSAPQLTIDSTSIANPKIGLKMPASLVAGTANTTESVAPTEMPSVTPVYGDPVLRNELSFQTKIPRGVTFTPSVSDVGEISWTNDGGLTNPTKKSIKGPKGDGGTIQITDITIDNGSSETADPSVEINSGSADYHNAKYSLSFHNLVGKRGPQGPQGPIGNPLNIIAAETITPAQVAEDTLVAVGAELTARGRDPQAGELIAVTYKKAENDAVSYWYFKINAAWQRVQLSGSMGGAIVNTKVIDATANSKVYSAKYINALEERLLILEDALTIGKIGGN